MSKIENVKKISKEKSLDTTQGVIWKQLLALFFPILFGTFFQQLYNTVDAIIVGQCLGKEALAAVGGGTATLINLLVGFFVGIGSGATVVVSQFFGAKNQKETYRSVHTAIALSIISGIIITILGVLVAPFVLRAIDIPEELYKDSLMYMRVYMAGILPVIVYNISSGILRAVGDTKSPLYFLIAGTIINIFLDILFISVFKWGIVGAASATIVSQLISMILTLRSLTSTNESYKLTISQIHIHAPILRNILKIGFPAGFQSVVFALSNTLVQANINALGTDSVAAWAVFGKVDSINWMILSAYGIAVSTFAGQNYGAKKYDRMLKGTYEGLALGGITVIAISTFICTCAPMLFKFFVNDAEVISIGTVIVKWISAFYLCFVPVEILSGSLRGAGKPFIPMIITATGICLIRILWLTFVVPLSQNIESIAVCYPISWIITSTMMTIYFLRKKWLPKND